MGTRAFKGICGEWAEIHGDVTEQWEMHQLEKERAKQERVSEPNLGIGEEQ